MNPAIAFTLLKLLHPEENRVTKLLYLDCTSGISGDMTLAALLDLGLDKDYLADELEKLGVGGYQLVFRNKERHGLPMLDVDVVLEDEGHRDSSRCPGSERTCKDILDLIDKSSIAGKAKDLSKAIFWEIARAEGKVHGVPAEAVRFHETGAVDSIVDIVGVSICIAALNPDRIYASELHDGRGFIRCRHGMLPVPVPAVAAMLDGTAIPYVQEAVETELITPTGMGIVKCLAEDYLPMPRMDVERTGYGLGKRETGMLGALRAYLGTL